MAQKPRKDIRGIEMSRWERGSMIGEGAVSYVYLATVYSNQDPDDRKLLAVKCFPVPSFGGDLLKNEKEILLELEGCPQIVRCFGNDVNETKHRSNYMIYSLFLEYAAAGTLHDRIKASSGAGLPISDIRHYTKSILFGLSHIHEKGYVHCDIKPKNLLLFPSSSSSSWDIKIADFGLAKKAGEPEKCSCCPHGTLRYASPEALICREYEPPQDVWALGCVVVEMVTGKRAWVDNEDVDFISSKIRSPDELPEIPECLSNEGKDFLSRIFARDPKKRWTANMLLNHPFILETEGDLVE